MGHRVPDWQHNLRAHGQKFHVLVAIMDWQSVVAWHLSNTVDVDFCVKALEEALEKGKPEIFNTDQGSQFTDTVARYPDAFSEGLKQIVFVEVYGGVLKLRSI